MNEADTPRLWYFAYGSNMQRATFCGRRGLTPSASVWAELPGYRLCFNLPIGPGERGVANIVLGSPNVHGVLHAITIEEARRLDRTEGVQRGYYDRIVARPLVEGLGELEAFTYSSRHAAPGRKPSPRYMGLLLEGAEEHALPAAYIEYLRGFELAADERDAS